MSSSIGRKRRTLKICQNQITISISLRALVRLVLPPLPPQSPPFPCFFLPQRREVCTKEPLHTNLMLPTYSLGVSTRCFLSLYSSIILILCLCKIFEVFLFDKQLRVVRAREGDQTGKKQRDREGRHRKVLHFFLIQFSFIFHGKENHPQLLTYKS